MTEPCSEEFYNAFSARCGSNHATCNCGRVHFTSTDTGCYYEGELEQLIKLSACAPETYIDIGNGSVTFVDVGGAYVYGCPCNTLQKYEAWVWGHRQQIMNYLKERTKNIAKAAQEELELFT